MRTSLAPPVITSRTQLPALTPVVEPAVKSTPESAPAKPAPDVVPTLLGTRLAQEARQARVDHGGRDPNGAPQMVRLQQARAADKPAADNLADKLRAVPAGTTAEKPLSGFQRFWRDFGVNPLAMFRRATSEQAPAEGSALPGGTPANAAALQSLRTELHAAIADLKPGEKGGLDDAGLRNFQGKLKSVAAQYGVDVRFKSGAPTVNWGDIPTLDVMDQGGSAAAHETVHVVQCVVGGVAALSSAAAARIQREQGRAPKDDAEIRATIPLLTPGERKAAFDAVVKPMEKEAYARFEQGAFAATGMFGKKSKDVEFFRDGLKKNTDAFCDAYLLARVPELNSGAGARFYGGVGHLARTHGETAVLLTGAGLTYKALAGAAFAINPLLGAAVMLPLGYLLYRSAVG